MSRYVALALTLFAIALPGYAADRAFDADACAKAVAPYLDEQAVAVLHVDLSAVDVGALSDKIAALAQMDADALPIPRKEASGAVKAFLAAGVKDVYIVVSLADVPEHSPFTLAFLPPVKEAERDSRIKDLTTEMKQLGLLDSYHFEPIGDALVGGEDATLKRLHALKPDAHPELAKAFAATDGGLAQLVLLPPRGAGKILESVMPTLPGEVGGGSSKVLTHGFRWAAIRLNAPKLYLGVTIQTADADSAKALLDLLKKTYTAIGKNKEVHEVLPDYDKLTDLFTPNIAEDRLTLDLGEKALTTTLQPLLAKLKETAGQDESSNRLKQLAIAALNHEAAYQAYPPAFNADKNGKPLLSWRVTILPYIEQGALYKEFHLDEPWDSEHNKKLIPRMPAIFRSTTDPKLAADFKTTYLAPIGEAMMFTGAKGVRIAEVPDGTSGTILFVHADDDQAVIWTKPDDLVIDPKAPLKGLGASSPGGFLAAFADGSVHFIPKGVDKKTLQGLFTRNGGEVVTPP